LPGIPSENVQISALARETGSPNKHALVWRFEAKAKGLAVPDEAKNAEGWSSEDKFAIVLDTAPLKSWRVLLAQGPVSRANRGVAALMCGRQRNWAILTMRPHR
jgi:hypothetical protein